jgi:twitching motility protein PilI
MSTPKKDSLFQIQSRLADRLKASTDTAQTASWLAVEIAGRGYLMPLHQSGEIFAWSDPHVVPYAKEWFLGVVNLRGALYGVASLAAFFKLTEMPQAAQKANIAERRLIGLHPMFELNLVLVVDHLAGLRTKAQMTRLDDTHLYQDEQGAAWEEIDFHALTQNPEFTSIVSRN